MASVQAHSMQSIEHCFLLYQVLVCDEEHIAHNEVLAQILDLLCHLVNYGYYDDQGDIDDVLHPLFELLNGKTDSPGNGSYIISFF